MPRERRKKGPAYTPPKRSIPKKDYTPNVKPHRKKPPRPDLNRGRQKTGEEGIQARAEALAEVKRCAEENAAKVPKRLRRLARIITPGAPIALQIPPLPSSQDLGADPVLRDAPGTPNSPNANPAKKMDGNKYSDGNEIPACPAPKQATKANSRRWRSKNNKRKGKKTEEKIGLSDNTAPEGQNNEGVGWTFDCDLRGLREILSNHPEKILKNTQENSAEDSSGEFQEESMD